MPYQIPDSESIPLVYDMIRREGLSLGGSSGVNVAGAIRLAKELGPGHVIVTLLCDSAMRYRARLIQPGVSRRTRAGAAGVAGPGLG